MEEELLGKSFDGSHNIDGLTVDFKTGAIDNLVFGGSDSDGNLVFIRDNDQQHLIERTDDWLDKVYLDNAADLLRRFSRMSTQDEAEGLAGELGPLFGSHYCHDGVCREPLDMWRAAAKFFEGAFSIRARLDSHDWGDLLDKSFEAELLLSDEQQKELASGKGVEWGGQQELIASWKLLFPSMPDDYRWLTLNSASEIDAGSWQDTRWDGPEAQEIKLWQTRPGEELSRFDETEKDREESRYESSPQVATAIHLNPRHHSYRAGVEPVTLRVGLGTVAIGEELAEKLCRNMLETLISIHTRQVRYSWMGHQFRPIFLERIRCMWFIFAIYLGQGTLAYCAHCGRPFWRNRTDKKYCSAACRSAANK